MRWLSLNWLDIALNVLVLGIVPGIVAAYGGHLAAEAISDVKRGRRVKLCFWFLFGIGIILTSWQQIRVAESDLTKEVRDTWADTMSIKALAPNPVPPPFAETKTALVARAEEPDISMRLVYPKEIAYQLLNTSRAVVRDPSVTPVIWNLDNGDNNPLPMSTVTASGDFVRPHEGMGPWSIAHAQNVAPAKKGDRLFGCITVSCPKCKRTKAYWVYAVTGDSAWYSEIKHGYPSLTGIFKNIEQIRKNPDAFFASVKSSERQIPANDPQQAP